MLRRQLGLPEEELLVIYTGRLHPVKGPDLLLSAWQGLQVKPGEGHLLILGSGLMEAGLHAQAGQTVLFKGGYQRCQPISQGGRPLCSALLECAVGSHGLWFTHSRQRSPVKQGIDPSWRNRPAFQGGG